GTWNAEPACRPGLCQSCRSVASYFIAEAMPDARRSNFVRRHPALSGVALLIALLLIGIAILLSNAQWLRVPLQRTLSSNLHRDLTMRDLRLRWGRQLTLVMDDVQLANLPGGSEPLMARIPSVQLTLSPLGLLVGRV